MRISPKERRQILKNSWSASRFIAARSDFIDGIIFIDTQTGELYLWNSGYAGGRSALEKWEKTNE